MLFEGIIFCSESSYSHNKLQKHYDDQILLKNGIIGIKRSTQRESPPDSYLAIRLSSHSKTEILSSSTTQNSVFSFSDDYLNTFSLDVGACYEEDTQRLTLSRSLFGQIPLYYVFIKHKIIAFSTSIHSLLQIDELRNAHSVNRNVISLYSTFLGNFSRQYTPETFYKNIHSVPPGHSVQISFEYTTVTSRTCLRPSKWDHLSTLEEFAEEFRYLFSRAVSSQFKAEPSTVHASHLSGGMDSSSISVMLRENHPDIQLHTIYDKTNTLHSDENLFAFEVANKINSTHHEIVRPQDDFSQLLEYTSVFATPSSSFLGSSLGGPLMSIAKSFGCSTIFNGAAGDSIVGSGLELMDSCFSQRNWTLLKDLLRKRVGHYSHAHEHSNWEKYHFEKKYAIVVNNFFFRRLGSEFLRLPVSTFAQLFREVSKHFDISYVYFALRGGRSLFQRLQKEQLAPLSSILVDDLLPRRFDTELSYHNIIETDASKEQRQSLNYVLNSQAILSSEQTYLLSEHHGITSYSPFLDSELFELCLAIPEYTKFGDGIGRAHFREAMKGLLPEKVRLRSGKTHVRASGQDMTLRMYRDAREILYNSTEIWEFVDRRKFAQQIKILENEKIPYQQKSATWFHISRTISLCLWLEWFRTFK